jgi:sigma-E factor negative regulatory protein RseB
MPVEESPGALLERMSTVLATRSYEGEFLRWADGHIERLHVIHRREKDGFTERLYVVGMPGREIIQQGGEVRRYLPEERRVLVELSPGKAGTLPGYLPVFNAAPQPLYELVAEGRETSTTGRLARVVVVRARDRYRLGYRLWVDEATAMPTRTDLVNAEGQVVEQVVFTELRLRNHVDDQELQPALAVRSFARVDVGPAPGPSVAPPAGLWSLAHLPPGFRLARRGFKWLPGASAPATHLVLTDGVATVSVFVEAPSPGRVPRTGSGRLGAAAAFSTVVEGHQVTAVGEVPPRTVEAIARQVVPR